MHHSHSNGSLKWASAPDDNLRQTPLSQALEQKSLGRAYKMAQVVATVATITLLVFVGVQQFSITTRRCQRP